MVCERAHLRFEANGESAGTVDVLRPAPNVSALKGDADEEAGAAAAAAAEAEAAAAADEEMVLLQTSAVAGRRAAVRRRVNELISLFDAGGECSTR